jgi:ATP/maltotriose-dependent transcriptional regulator MalT
MPGTMPPQAEAGPALERGRSCLIGRDWPGAERSFRAALAAGGGAAAWEGLATALLFLDDAEGSREAAERAHGDYVHAGDVRAAARVAIQLAVYHETYRGESAISNGWFERARTLLQQAPGSPEEAWLALWFAHVKIHLQGRIADGERSLAEALRANDALRIGGELELLARGLSGLMAISAGRIEEGLRRLDEATAGVVASAQTSVETVGWTYCYVLEACENVRDFDRAAQWLERAWRVEGELKVQHYVGFCRSHYVAVLTWKGDYARAEYEIDAMRGELDDVAPASLAVCDVRLGEVRRRQGRLDEARSLLEPRQALPLAMLGLAALACDTGRPQTAVELVDRYLRRVSPSDLVRRLHGLDILVRASIERGDFDPACAALEEIERTASPAAPPLLRALAAECRALLQQAEGRLDEARRHFEDALDLYDLGGVPYEAAAARIRLGDLLAALRREDTGRATLETAATAARRLGARGLAARAAAALERLDRPACPASNPAGLSRRELDVLALIAQGVSNQEIGERLFISAHTVKRHVANILNKLDLPSRAAAAAFAIRNGLAR